MNKRILLFLIFITTVPFLTAQERISLTDVEKVKEYLSLNDTQYNSINKSVKEIESILDKDQKIIDGLKERVKKNDEPDFFEKIKVKRGRDSRISKIEDLIKKIERQLNGDQKEKFKNVN